MQGADTQVQLKANHIVDAVFFTLFGIGCLAVAGHFAVAPGAPAQQTIHWGLTIFFAALGGYLVLACTSSPYRRRISLDWRTGTVTVEYSYIRLPFQRTVSAVHVKAVEWVVVNRDGGESEIHYARVRLRDGLELSISVSRGDAEAFARALRMPLDEVDLHNPMVDTHGPAPSIWNARRVLLPAAS